LIIRIFVIVSLSLFRSLQFIAPTKINVFKTKSKKGKKKKKKRERERKKTKERIEEVRGLFASRRDCRSVLQRERERKRERVSVSRS